MQHQSEETPNVRDEGAMDVSFTGAEASTFLKDVNAEIRSGFIRKVYLILVVQLLLTGGLAYPIMIQGNDWVQKNAWVAQVASVMSLVVMLGVMCCCQSVMRTYPQNYIFLFTITVCQALIIGFICAFYETASVVAAAGMTAGIFLLLTAYACFTKTDFTGMGPYLMVLLMGLVLMGFIGLFFSSETFEMIYAALGAILFSFYIVFDTQRIVGGGHTSEFTIDDYVLAALTLYLDIINLFLFLLQLFGKRS